ncbi:hypothetical protein [Noviherbaspirillum malthae]|uniref:hypothetical protein n=1 Tax=Noviherbaspirillum malthae TaxID=1260987 RepID=UPI00188E7FEB|nr:hypothetical protein [Noviherbaspirillum malthae]
MQRYTDFAAVRTLPPSTEKAVPSTIISLSSKGLEAAAQAESDAALRQISTSSRFRNAGINTLEKFGTGALDSTSQVALPGHLDNEFTLSITLGGGKAVSLTIANAGEDMFIQVGSAAELSPDERSAIANLGQAFQSAIDGLTQNVPQVRLAELTRLDTAFIQSIDLHAKTTLETVPPATQSLDFHIDSRQRRVSVEGPSGKIDVGVDTSRLQGLGTNQQQAKAIDNYLKTFDQAATRGHGDRQLMTMFKDAFVDMSLVARTDDSIDSGTRVIVPWKPSREDKAVLTGLPDFSTSVTQAARWSNPLRQDEVDGFKYEASQDTHLAGESFANRSITQSQRSSLSAQFHSEPDNSRKLKLNIAPGELMTVPRFHVQQEI